MAVFRVEKNSGYTVMSNHHLRNRALSLKAKGLLSQMLSLPEDWDYTLQGLARINRESIDAIRQAIRELEQAGYIQRSRERDEKGRLRGADYVIFELPQPIPASVSPTLENPTLENPTQEKPTLENPMQLNAEKFRVCSRAIFCRISSRSSGVTGTRRTIFRVRFVIVSPRFLGVWGTPQQAFLPGVATLPMLATLPFPTTMTPQHPRFARKMQKKNKRMILHPLNDRA